MASILEKFQKNIVGSKGKHLDFIPLLSSKGDFSTVADMQVILNSWNNILLTKTRTYMHNPEYGSELYTYIFEPADEVTVEAIKEEIRYRLMLYDNRAYITSIDVKFISDGHGFVLDIGVEYEGEKDSLRTAIIDQTLLNLDV